MARTKSPEIIEITGDEFLAIQSRINSGMLCEEDKKVLCSILATYSWLQRQLQSTKLTMHRLKKAFGFSSEKRSMLKKNNSKSGADVSIKGTSSSSTLSLDALQGLEKDSPEKK